MLDDLPSFEDALHEYYKFKNKFESDNMSFKKKILNNQILSKKEKRSEFLKFKPACVNCKRRSNKGTLFSTIFHKATDKNDAYRTLKASCGDLADPCNFEIIINISKYESVESILESLQKEIKEYKDEIINDKNKLLFGLITTETAVDNFDTNKSYVGELTSLYERYLSDYVRVTDNIEQKNLLDESLVKAYQSIDEIKDCIKKMNQNDNAKYAADAANIYQTKLFPLLNQIRHIKYKETIAYHDDYTDTCRLIQNKNSIEQLESASTKDNKVVAFDVGLKARKPIKKPGAFDISESEESEEPIKIDIKKPTEVIEKQIPEVVQPDEPIIGQGEDGISWTNPLYQKLWKALPVKLKNEFKTNIDWMKKFMFKCVNTRQTPGNNGCELTTPPDLIVPPKQLPDGSYDLGVQIYNKVFNKQPKSLQSTYLTLYKLDPQTGAKNYSMFEDSINKLVGQELDFGRGFF